MIVSVEDAADDVMKPRLMAMGADLSMITFVTPKVVIRKPDREPVVVIRDHIAVASTSRRIAVSFIRPGQSGLDDAGALVDRRVSGTASSLTPPGHSNRARYSSVRLGGVDIIMVSLGS